MCLETATGKERWRKSLPADFGGSMMSMWKWSESPLVDGDRADLHARRARRRPRRRGQEDGQGRSGGRPSPTSGPKGKDGAAYSSIVVSNGGGREAVRAAPGSRPRRRARDRRQVPLGLQPGGQRRGQHPDPGRARRTTCSPPRATRRGRRCWSCCPTAGDGVRRREVYFLSRDLPEPPRRHRPRGQPPLRRPRPQQGLPHLPRVRHRARSSGAETSGTPARAPRP